MDDLTVRESKWRGVDAWTVTGRGLELVLTKIGGHIAAIRQPGEELTPLWQPPWRATSPQEGAEQPDVYGGGPDASLLAAIVGHNLCLDRFGPPWPGENRPVHGEAGVTEWLCTQPDEKQVLLDARLSDAALRVTRGFTVEGDTLTLTTTVSHGFGEPREIEWAEHVTLGDPFLDGAEFTAAVDGAWIWGGELRDAWRFPNAVAESEVDVDQALRMPRADDPNPAGDIVTTRVVKGWFRAARVDLGRFLRYEWDADAFPWLCLWTQHRSRTAKPWNGATRARGMEFSTKPYPEGKPPEERAETYQGRPSTCTVPPGDGLTRSITVQWGRI